MKPRGKIKSAALGMIPFATPVMSVLKTANEEKVDVDINKWRVHVVAIVLLCIAGYMEPVIFIVGTGGIAIVSFMKKDKLSENMGFLHLSASIMALIFTLWELFQW